MGETTRGRPKLNLDFAPILGAVHRHRQVVAAAQELGCSDAYIHGRFKQAGLSLKQVLQARHPDKVNGPNETRSLVLSRPGQGVSRGRPQANSHLTLARAHVSRHLSRRLPYYLTPEEAHLLIDSAENERDQIFLRLLWETGVRVSEAVAIKLDQVGRDGIPVRGKGDVERVVFIQDSLVSAILFYVQDTGLERHDYLFPSRKGGHITKEWADQIIKQAALRARLERTVHAHLFRHGYAINFLNCSGRLDALQEQLGHRDINTTRIYLRLTDEDIKREVARIQF